MSYDASQHRYDLTPIRRSGRSGLQLPVFSLGLWQNFGEDRDFSHQRETVLQAFDRGVFHFDLANNYGPPAGQAEVHFGQILRDDLAAYRDELIISTKAGWDMHPGPHGSGGSRKHLVESLDRSLARMAIDRVDIFYHHRPDPGTPVEETAVALDYIVRSGRAHYVGISSYSAEASRKMAQLLRELGTPLAIHQPSYSMVNRWIETDGLLDVAEQEGFGVIGFTPLAQGMLTDKYLRGIPAGSRAAAADGSFTTGAMTPDVVDRLRALAEIAARRGQSLAQLAIAWALRDPRVTSLVGGASSAAQLEENLGATQQTGFTPEELAEIDALALDAGVDLWASPRLGGPLPDISARGMGAIAPPPAR